MQEAEGCVYGACYRVGKPVDSSSSRNKGRLSLKNSSVVLSERDSTVSKQNRCRHHNDTEAT